MNAPVKKRWINHTRNTSQQFGWLAIALHWFSALLVIGLTGLGLWMVTLNYYSQWYYPAPNLHKSLGMVFAGLLLLRAGWRWLNVQPDVHGHRWERRAAHISHWLIYALLFGIVLSGYLIVTAEGAAISIFNLIDIPALPLQFNRQADIAGWWHRWMCYVLIALVVLHIAAAIKHQFFNRDGTLSRMLGLNISNVSSK